MLVVFPALARLRNRVRLPISPLVKLVDEHLLVSILKLVHRRKLAPIGRCENAKLTNLAWNATEREECGMLLVETNSLDGC